MHYAHVMSWTCNTKQASCRTSWTRRCPRLSNFLTRDNFRRDAQNREVGGGGGAYYGQSSSSLPLQDGFSGNLVVLSDEIVLVEDAPKADGWVHRLHVELKSMDAHPHTEGYWRRIGYQPEDRAHDNIGSNIERYPAISGDIQPPRGRNVTQYRTPPPR